MLSSVHALLALTLITRALAQVSLYRPCPLLGPFFPPPTLNASSPFLRSALDQFTSILDQYVAEADGDFGPITPNKTSFSIALFGGNKDVNGDAEPILYEYHHGAADVPRPDSNSQYAIGDVTQVLTVLTLLAELGPIAWEDSIVEYLPELVELAGHNASTFDPLTTVDWSAVTLGSLSGHMAGIARDSNVCNFTSICPRESFLSSVAAQSPVYLPDSTPIYSLSAFQILAFALEQHTNQTFATLLASRITSKLNMTSTSFLHLNNAALYGSSSSPSFSNGTGSPASLGLTSTIHDLALLGRSILTSSLLPASTTRKWLKPFTSTSNLANSVGRPWEIYHYNYSSTGTVIDVYAKIGSVGNYGSYFGFVPDYDVGFVILAVNNGGDEDVGGGGGSSTSPDMNAYGDLSFVPLEGILRLSRDAARKDFVGRYGNEKSRVVLNVTDEGPGLVVKEFVVNGTDVLEEIAQEQGIEVGYLDFRLYPTNLVKQTDSGTERGYRGVIQDQNAIVDAGTPTCISWMTVGEVVRDGVALDGFVIEMDGSGGAVAVRSPALSVRFERT